MINRQWQTASPAAKFCQIFIIDQLERQHHDQRWQQPQQVICGGPAPRERKEKSGKQAQMDIKNDAKQLFLMKIS